MSTAMVKVMQQRLTRGTPVIVADSFKKAKLRGAKRIVASKGPVKCNREGRCAGDWCESLAVFVTDPKSRRKDKEMGWRGGTTKICLTHLKDEKGELILPPPLLRNRMATALAGNGTRVHEAVTEVVTWDDLARAHLAGDLDRLTLLARKLKSDNDSLTQRVIEAQDRLIKNLSE